MSVDECFERGSAAGRRRAERSAILLSTDLPSDENRPSIPIVLTYSRSRFELSVRPRTIAIGSVPTSSSAQFWDETHTGHMLEVSVTGQQVGAVRARGRIN